MNPTTEREAGKLSPYVWLIHGRDGAESALTIDREYADHMMDHGWAVTEYRADNPDLRTASIALAQLCEDILALAVLPEADAHALRQAVARVHSTLDAGREVSNGG